jgi:ribonuclease BN (tRNA processing enzyme)
MRVVLLGTAGGPAIKRTRAQPSNAVVVNDALYVVDTGNGVCRQLALAGIPSRSLRAVFVTHHHSDHVADFGTLFLRAWASGLVRPVDAFGPPPLRWMTDRYLEYMSWDIRLRMEDEGRVPLASLVRVHEFAEDGVVYRDENVTVTAAEVPHGVAKPAYAFRFDTSHHSVVFSGDTSPSDSLVALARDCDVLVHEVLSVPGVDLLVDRIEAGNEALKRHIIEAHTPAEDVGRIATRAACKRLVLNHFVPSGLTEFEEPRWWTDPARQHFAGDVVMGEDLLVVSPE